MRTQDVTNMDDQLLAAIQLLVQQKKPSQYDLGKVREIFAEVILETPRDEHGLWDPEHVRGLHKVSIALLSHAPMAFSLSASNPLSIQVRGVRMRTCMYLELTLVSSPVDTGGLPFTHRTIRETLAIFIREFDKKGTI